MDQTFGLEQFFSPPTHTIGGYKDGSDATPVFCVASRTPLVVVAKPWANKEKDKKALSAIHMWTDCTFVYMHLFWYIIYTYTVAIASR